MSFLDQNSENLKMSIKGKIIILRFWWGLANLALTTDMTLTN